MSLTNEIKFLARNIEITDETSRRIQLGGFLTYQEAVKLQKACVKNRRSSADLLGCDKLLFGDLQQPERSYIVYSPTGQIHTSDGEKVISVEFKPTPIYSFANTVLENEDRDIGKIIKYDGFDLVSINIDKRAAVKTKLLDVVVSTRLYTKFEDKYRDFDDPGFPIDLHIIYECSKASADVSMSISLEGTQLRFSNARTNSITMNTSMGASLKDNLNARFMEKAFKVNFSDYIIGAIDYLNGELSGICDDIRDNALLMLSKVTFNSEYTSKIDIPYVAEKAAPWY